MKLLLLSRDAAYPDDVPVEDKGLPLCGIDRFRQIAALLIVGIHTYPLSSISENLNFIICNVISRIAVPFFLMVTGYFLLPQYFSKEICNTKPLINFIKKTGLFYIIATVLYLPVSIYAGYYSQGTAAAAIFKNIIFDGTFYHLWYLPASIIGVLLIYFLGRRFSIRTVLGISAFLYLFGLLGDSYYGLAVKIPVLNSVYSACFHVFSYTRNGFFYAPVFLALGAMTAKMKRRLDVRVCLIGFAASMLIMLAEGSALHFGGIQRHDSMYAALLPCMFFLFQLLLSRVGKTRPILRDVTMWVYLLHPLFIVAVRGAAKAASLTSLLVDNSMIHYISVCLLSISTSLLIAKLQHRRHRGTVLLCCCATQQNRPPVSKLIKKEF